MNSNMGDASVTVASTLGGVLLVVVNVGSEELVKTSILAAVGAVVSLGMTLLMKWAFKKIRKC